MVGQLVPLNNIPVVYKLFPYICAPVPPPEYTALPGARHTSALAEWAGRLTHAETAQSGGRSRRWRSTSRETRCKELASCSCQRRSSCASAAPITAARPAGNGSGAAAE